MIRSAVLGTHHAALAPALMPRADRPAATPRIARQSASYVSVRPSASVSWSSSISAMRRPNAATLCSTSHQAGTFGYGSESGTCVGQTVCQGRGAGSDPTFLTIAHGHRGGQLISGV